ncbi:MAG: hypothetical protein ACLR23_08290 [Clostridia bacterium]
MASALGMGTIEISGADGGRVERVLASNTIALPEHETFIGSGADAAVVYHALCAQWKHIFILVREEEFEIKDRI